MLFLVPSGIATVHCISLMPLSIVTVYSISVMLSSIVSVYCFLGAIRHNYITSFSWFIEAIRHSFRVLLSSFLPFSLPGDQATGPPGMLGMVGLGKYCILTSR